MTDRNKYSLSLNLSISSYDGSQGHLSTNLNKIIQANSIKDLIKILEEFDAISDGLNNLVDKLTVNEHSEGTSGQ